MNINRLIAMLLPLLLKYIFRKMTPTDSTDPNQQSARNLSQRAGQIAKLTRRLF